MNRKNLGKMVLVISTFIVVWKILEMFQGVPSIVPEVDRDLYKLKQILLSLAVIIPYGMIIFLFSLGNRFKNINGKGRGFRFAVVLLSSIIGILLILSTGIVENKYSNEYLKIISESKNK